MHLSPGHIHFFVTVQLHSSFWQAHFPFVQMHLFLTVSSDFSELDVALVPLKEHDILEYVFRVNSVY